MDKFKEMYFKAGCHVNLITRKDRELFLAANIDNDTLLKWKNEFAYLEYNRFFGELNSNTLTRFHFYLYFGSVLVNSPVGFDSIEKSIIMLEKILEHNLISYFEVNTRSTAYVMTQFIMLSKMDIKANKIIYDSKDEYKGIIPYLWKNKKYDLYERALNVVTTIAKYINCHLDTIADFKKSTGQDDTL
ncbi:MAG: hypothetical protein K6E20_07495 [Acholeplasmatales bacterium]|nr:hypothetical protein [Acholeplasmatales bacterium]